VINKQLHIYKQIHILLFFTSLFRQGVARVTETCKYVTEHIYDMCICWFVI